MALLWVLLLTSCARSEWRDGFGDWQSGAIPGDVRRWVKAAQLCGYWTGEDVNPADQERYEMMQIAVRQNCPGLAERRPALLRRYADRADVLAIMTTAWTVFED